MCQRLRELLLSVGETAHGFGRIILVEHALVARVSGVQKQRFREERRKLGALTSC